ncbi:DUF4328 domain-containing protein [Actinomycetes bacterium KLBMP 9759]
MPTTPERLLRVTWWGRLTAALAITAAVLMVPGVVTAWARYAAVRARIRPGVGVFEGGGYVDTSHFADAVASVPRWDAAAASIPVVVVAATASMMIWVAAVRRDIGALSPHHRFRFSRRFAVGSLAIPLANLWWSRQVIDDLWAARPGRGRWIVRAWQACLIGVLLVNAAGNATTTVIQVATEPADVLVVGVTTELVRSIHQTARVLLVLGGAFLLAVVIGRIDGRRGEPAPVPAPTSDEDGAGRSWPIVTLAMCAVPIFLATAAGLSFLTVAVEWSEQGPTGRAFASFPFIGAAFLFAQAGYLASLLVKLAGRPQRYADRMAGALFVVLGIDVMIVTVLPTFVTDPLVAGLALGALLATAVALPRLERLSRRTTEHPW